ncbi:MAG: 3,4-dihydroxy-2-butanone-4-phosphate synthase [Phycisphaeraceae bacterium]|nr:3,4-dihydroxy-2-butanone-4-phosphate synthase [Phycisphaeraceae bacterium]
MFSPITEILDDLRAGRMIVLTDDEDRENEGDLVLPAQFATPETITFMLTSARGYLCLSLTESDCDRLDLHPQGPSNTSSRGTAFTVSIDGHPRHGFTTGVSARERARCIQMMIDPRTTPNDFVRPGHINPLRSRDGGVLVRTGQTEGSVDLCRLAGLYPAAVIIEIMKDDGEMARVPDLEVFCKKHNIKMCSVAQLIAHRLADGSLVKRIGPVRTLKTAFGDFDAIAYESAVDALPHLVLACGGVGRVPSNEPTLVRMHRRHLLGDVFAEVSGVGSSSGQSSGDMLRDSLRLIAKEGRGAVVYLRTQMPDEPEDDLEALLQTPRRTADAPPHASSTAGHASRTQRDFGVGGQILRDLGISKMRLVTNSARDLPGLDAFGLEIVERVSISP